MYAGWFDWRGVCEVAGYRTARAYGRECCQPQKEEGHLQDIELDLRFRDRSSLAARIRTKQRIVLLVTFGHDHKDCRAWLSEFGEIYESHAARNHRRCKLCFTPDCVMGRNNNPWTPEDDACHNTWTRNHGDHIRARTLDRVCQIVRKCEMKSKSNTQQQTTQKLRKLCQSLADLKRGESFSITRLTAIKSLCPDAKTAARYTAHLAAMAQQRKEFASKSARYTTAEKKWHVELAEEALEEIDLFLQRCSDSRRKKLYELLHEAREVNNIYRNIPYGAVREIHNWRVLLVEKAMQCALAYDETAAAFWAYQVARDYAEKYDPHYGTGLIPASAPMLEETLDFWCNHYFGQSAAEWCATGAKKAKR